MAVEVESAWTRINMAFSQCDFRFDLFFSFPVIF